jgi:predicted DNA-binding WGR domain protein
MTDWTVYLEFAEGTSSKFWRARVEGKTLYVNYGKIGSNGQTQVKELGDASAATAEYDKLVREKRKKGYVEGSGAGAAGAAQVDDDSDDGDDDEPLAKKPAVKAAAPAAKPLVAAARSPAGAAPGVPGHRLRLDAGNRQVDTTLYLDGATVRMDSRETYGSAEAAKKAFDRLKQLLASDGYKEG